MRSWIIGIATLIGIVIIASALGVESATVGSTGGDAFAYTFDVLINFFGSLFDGASSEAVG